MAETRTTAGHEGWPDPYMRAQVAMAALAMLSREMKDAGTPDAIAIETLRAAPDKIDAALTRGRRALVFYQVDATTARGIVSDDDAKLEKLARLAHAAGSRVLCFNPALIAGLAAAIEPRVNALIEATAGPARFDA